MTGTVLITPARLLRVAPRVPDAAAWALALHDAATRYGINTPGRVAAWLAQLAHESAGFTKLEESLSYSAQRMVMVWPSRFAMRDALGQVVRDRITGKPVPNMALALQYERKPEALANFVYGGRMGNGPPASGDGWRFRGRGAIQLTGREGYTAASRALGIDLVANPDLLLQPRESALAAAWFWHARGLNALADRGAFSQITERINGGQVGAEHRESLYAIALRDLGDPRGALA